MENERSKNNRFMAILLPSLVGVYIGLNYLETNIRSLEYTDTLRILGGMILFGAIILVAYRATGLSLTKSSILAAFTLAFCAYGFNLFLVVQVLFIPSLSFLIFNCIAAAIFGVIYLLLYRTGGKFTLSLHLLTTIFVVSTIVSLSKISLYEYYRMNEIDIASEISKTSLKDLTAPAEKRNIYYIVMDRYADQRTLTAEYDFDNSEFTDTLRDYGFFVADKSAANYPFTYQSLSSSMNMVYHNNVADRMGENTDDLVPYIRLIKKNAVTEFLKDQGYKYVHMGSWWAPTEASPLADENFQTTHLGRVELRFLRRTIFQPLLFSFHDDTAKQSIDPNQCDRVPRKLARLKELGSTQQPTFVFAHFLVPHDPFVFDENGNCKGAEEASSISLRQNYLGQLQYANSLLTELLESLLSQPGPKPIIIIQADEGPYPARFRKDEDGFQWASASAAEMRQKMRILNAYYFPDTDNRMFYDSITPVNTFRLMLNTYFNANLQLLPDLNFAIPNNDDRYGFFDVTDTVQ